MQIIIQCRRHIKHSQQTVSQHVYRNDNFSDEQLDHQRTVRILQYESLFQSASHAITDAAYCCTCRTYRGQSVCMLGSQMSPAERLNRSRCSFEAYSCRSKEPCVRCGAHWRHLANTVERSVHSGDASLCQITLATCYLSGWEPAAPHTAFGVLAVCA